MKKLLVLMFAFCIPTHASESMMTHEVAHLNKLAQQINNSPSVPVEAIKAYEELLKDFLAIANSTENQNSVNFKRLIDRYTKSLIVVTKLFDIHFYEACFLDKLAQQLNNSNNLPIEVIDAYNNLFENFQSLAMHPKWYHSENTPLAYDRYIESRIKFMKLFNNYKKDHFQRLLRNSNSFQNYKVQRPNMFHYIDVAKRVEQVNAKKAQLTHDKDCLQLQTQNAELALANSNLAVQINTQHASELLEVNFALSRFNTQFSDNHSELLVVNNKLIRINNTLAQIRTNIAPQQ